MTLASPQQRATQLLPFPLARRLKIEQIGVAKDFALDGGVVEFELPRIGYGYGLLVRVAGNLVVSTATLVLKGAGVYNYLRRATVDFPGESDLVKASGDSIHLLNQRDRPFGMYHLFNDEPAAGSLLDANAWATGKLTKAALLTVGTNPWNLLYWIPFTRNSRDLRGMRPLGHGGERARLLLQPSTEADFVTVGANADSAAVDVECYIAYFDAAPANATKPEDHAWDRWAVHIEEVKTDIPAVGDRLIEIDPDGVILDMVSRVVLNDAPTTTDVTHVSLKLDRRNAIDNVPILAHALAAFYQTRILYPVGAIPFPFDQHAPDIEAIDAASGPRGREWLFSDEFEDVNPILTIAAGATLGSVHEAITAVKRLVRI